MRVPVRLLPLAALASWEAFRIAACVLAGRAARQSRRRWERWLPEILVPCRNRRGRRTDARRRRGVPDDSSVPGPRDGRRNRRRARGERAGPAATPSTRHIGREITKVIRPKTTTPSRSHQKGACTPRGPRPCRARRGRCSRWHADSRPSSRRPRPPRRRRSAVHSSKTRCNS